MSDTRDFQLPIVPNSVREIGTEHWVRIADLTQAEIDRIIKAWSEVFRNHGLRQ